jgi:hypothetical protein
MRIATYVTAACLALLGTVISAQTVSYDFDRNANFSKFRTYTWVAGSNLNDGLNHERIVRAIDTQLAARGFVKLATAANADVLVAYHARFKEDLQVNGSSFGPGAYRFAGSRSGTARVEEIVIGTLAVDMVDARTNKIVWRGMATKELDVDANPGKREKNINKAAAKIFKNYPPVSR